MKEVDVSMPDIKSTSTSTGGAPGKSTTDPPFLEQLIRHEGKIYSVVKEGRAHILVPEEKSEASITKKKGPPESTTQAVFYNPIQQFNRDLSVLAIKVFAQELSDRRSQRHLENDGIQRRNRGKKRKREADKPQMEAVKQEQPVEPNLQGEIDEISVGAIESEDRVAGSAIATELKLNGLSGPSISMLDDSPTAPYESEEIVPEPTADKSSSVSNVPRTISFRILDALSATGLRALRYALEIPQTTSVVANDMSPTAIDLMKLNITHNGLDRKIKPNLENAISHMYSFAGSKVAAKYDVIDLDPYGTAVPFLDGAIQALSNGGLLCVTCTDPGVFAATGYPEKSFALYGGIPFKGPACHEVGLRLILHAISSSAARYGAAMEPLLSLSIDFYARVFVRIRKAPAEVKFLAGKTMLVYNCDEGCGAWNTQPLARNRAVEDKKGNTFYKHSLAQSRATEECDHCGSRLHIAGPMFAGPLHSTSFVQRLLASLTNLSPKTYATKKRLEGMLTTALEEAQFADSSPTAPPPPSQEQPNSDAQAASTPSTTTNPTPKSIPTANTAAALDPYPLLTLPSTLARALHAQTPSEAAIRAALHGLGFRTARSHTRAGSLKTDAPWSVLWGVMREWVVQRAPVKRRSLVRGGPGWRILFGAEESRGILQEKERRLELLEGLLREDAEDEMDEMSIGVERGVVVDGETRNVVFDEESGGSGKGAAGAGKKLLRYQMNPRPNWGPMTKAKAS